MKIKIAIAFTLILFAGWFFIKTTKIAYANAKNNSVCIQELNGNGKSMGFQFDSAYSSTQEFHSKFPYNKILNECNIYDYNGIKKLIESMSQHDSIEMNNQQQIASLIADSLSLRHIKNMNYYNYDSLMVLYKFAQKMKYYADCDFNYATMYQVIYSGLMQNISQKMGVFFDNDPNLKFNEQFTFLNDLLHCDKYGCIVSNSSLEKIVDNVTHSKWDYLFSKFVYDSNWITKLGVAFLLLIQLFLFYFTFKYFKKK